MKLKDRKLQAAALMNEGKTNPEIAEAMNLRVDQVGYLLHQARLAGFKLPPRNFGTREHYARKGRTA